MTSISRSEILIISRIVIDSILSTYEHDEYMYDLFEMLLTDSRYSKKFEMKEM